MPFVAVWTPDQEIRAWSVTVPDGVPTGTEVGATSVPVPDSTFRRVPTNVISIAPLIGDAIHRIHTGESVGALFS